MGLRRVGDGHTLRNHPLVPLIHSLQRRQGKTDVIETLTLPEFRRRCFVKGEIVLTAAREVDVFSIGFPLHRHLENALVKVLRNLGTFHIQSDVAEAVAEVLGCLGHRGSNTVLRQT